VRKPRRLIPKDVRDRILYGYDRGRNDRGSEVAPVKLPPPREKTRMVSLRLPVRLIEELDKLGKRSGLDRTQLIVHFCWIGLREVERPPEPAPDEADPPQASRSKRRKR
jgi:hypothetical protein